MNEVSIARCLFVGFFLLLAAGVMILPRAYILRGAPDTALWRDLRWWALLLLAVHVYVYWRF
ncbi:MAG: hypothetical protein JXA90_10760 [Planctomycetes bacterium]|nr:hypothetical protein [Planctomycetota bacterium]